MPTIPTMPILPDEPNERRRIYLTTRRTIEAVEASCRRMTWLCGLSVVISVAAVVIRLVKLWRE